MRTEFEVFMPHAKETRLIYKRLGIPGYTTDIDTLKDVADAICVDFPAETKKKSFAKPRPREAFFPSAGTPRLRIFSSDRR